MRLSRTTILGLVTLVVIALACAPADAITITSGTIGAWQGGDFGGAYNIHGEGYDLVSFRHGGNEPVSFAIYTSGGRYDEARDLSHTVALLFGPLDGELTWTIASVTVPRPDVITSPFSVVGVPAPFSMTGVINGVPLDGVGTFTLGALSHDSGWHVWSVGFTFETPESNGLAPVPEPGTLVLVGLGAAGVGAWWRRRR